MSTNQKISKHFYRHEVACKCGCGFDTIDSEVIRIADLVRDFLGYPMIVLSGARCAKHNEDIGGKTNSQHIKARALDLHIPKEKDAKLAYEMLCIVFPNKYGLGLYTWGIHIDTKTGTARRWDYT
jgi:uncharacterized protein YcbK (DUF882 family)